MRGKSFTCSGLVGEALLTLLPLVLAFAGTGTGGPGGIFILERIHMNLGQ